MPRFGNHSEVRSLALEEVTVTTKLTGRVAAVPVKEGQRVRAGQVLVRLEDAEILAQVRQADALDPVGTLEVVEGVLRLPLQQGDVRRARTASPG